MVKLLEGIFMIGYAYSAYVAIIALIEYACHYVYHTKHGGKVPGMSATNFVSIMITILVLAKLIWDNLYI